MSQNQKGDICLYQLCTLFVTWSAIKHKQIREIIDAARKFYEAEKYQAAKAVRELAAKAHLVLVEGELKLS